MRETCGVPARRALFPRPTRSASLLVLLAIILELLGRLIGSTGVTVAAAAALGAVLGDAILTPRIDRTRVTRKGPIRMTVGVPAPVELTILAPDRRWGIDRQLVITDAHPALSADRVLCPRLRRGAIATATHAPVPLHRGYWRDGGSIEIAAFSPLGGFVRHWTARYEGELWVHPAAAPPARLPEISAARATGTAASTRSGTGTDLFAVREWRTGDHTGEIHWRATARRGQLIVRERERPVQTALTVAVGHADGGADWEASICTACATALGALRAGRLVALVSDAGVEHPATAVEIQDWFAEVAARSDPSVQVLQSAVQQTGRGSTLLWAGADPITPALDHAARSAGAIAIQSLTARPHRRGRR
ncbi:MAG TPA: DUF58 domain-containing protein [Mycobacteriales bacterium]|nr:DUF58 domain-containing protein [Mycobacteriales bacterium]